MPERSGSERNRKRLMVALAILMFMAAYIIRREYIYLKDVKKKINRYK
jgi:hypothetical protein|tara:strand:+ start:1948 stop:2091 length:144 start_codon:yes stop_codon:yes gene_type:complete